MLVLPLFSLLVYFRFVVMVLSFLLFFFFFNDTATTEIYTLSLHDALPICEAIDFPYSPVRLMVLMMPDGTDPAVLQRLRDAADRKSTRLNSSHVKRSRMPSSA